MMVVRVVVERAVVRNACIDIAMAPTLHFPSSSSFFFFFSSSSLLPPPSYLLLLL